MNSKNYFNNLIKRGLIKEEVIGVDQIKALIKSAGKNLLAAEKIIKIDEEACYAMAYNAMLKIARVIIYIHGYRPDDGQQHKTTVEAAGVILGEDFKLLILRFDKMRRKRNQFTYEPLLPISEKETRQALETAKEFFEKAKFFIQKIDVQKNLF